MKKRFTLIPVIAIVLAVLTGLFTTFFTTPLVCYFTNGYGITGDVPEGESDIGQGDYFYNVKKSGKITRFAYALNPSLENLNALVSLYSTNTYIQGTYKGDTPPSDFLKYAVKYSKLFYETKYSENEAPFAIPQSAETIDETFTFYTLPNGLEYAKALYLDGKTEESEKVAEELFDAIIKQKNPSGAYKYYLKDYLYLVYSAAENDGIRQWVVEKESELEKVFELNKNISIYKMAHGFLFSNPDYDCYVSGKWPDFEKAKNESEVYFSQVRPFKEQNFTDYIYWTEYGQDKEILCGKYMKYYEYDYRDYEGYDSIQDDRLYVVSLNRDTGKGKITLFTDYEVHNYYDTGYNDGIFQITKDGVYTVINRNELVLLDSEGKIVKSFYKSSEGEIKALLVKDKLIWFICKDTIYRIFIPENVLDTLYKGVDFECFAKFLAPISNLEVEWLEVHPKDNERAFTWERACYYNSVGDSLVVKECIPDSQPQERIYPERRWWAEGDEHFKLP